MSSCATATRWANDLGGACAKHSGDSSRPSRDNPLCRKGWFTPLFALPFPTFYLFQTLMRAHRSGRSTEGKLFGFAFSILPWGIVFLGTVFVRATKI